MIVILKQIVKNKTNFGNLIENFLKFCTKFVKFVRKFWYLKKFEKINKI